jgi:hypothetical protein
MVLGLALCAIATIAVLLTLRSAAVGERLVPAQRAWLISAISAAAWLLMSSFLFQFDLGKLLGVLLATLWLAGCIGLFRRAQLSEGWSALVGVALLYIALHFVVDGFALSHVDFRFAANKIIPFQEEWLRAPQLIAWAVVKYLFILLPIFAVLVLTMRKEVALQMLQLGWWRELMIVLNALGLAIFDQRGMDELCREEIYFWTFLNFGVWLLCLAAVWINRNTAPQLQPEPVAAT